MYLDVLRTMFEYKLIYFIKHEKIRPTIIFFVNFIFDIFFLFFLTFFFGFFIPVFLGSAEKHKKQKYFK